LNENKIGIKQEMAIKEKELLGKGELWVEIGQE